VDITMAAVRTRSAYTAVRGRGANGKAQSKRVWVLGNRGQFAEKCTER